MHYRFCAIPSTRRKENINEQRRRKLCTAVKAAAGSASCATILTRGYTAVVDIIVITRPLKRERAFSSDRVFNRAKLNGRGEFELIAQCLDREMPFCRRYEIMRNRGTRGTRRKSFLSGTKRYRRAENLTSRLLLMPF